MKDEKKRVIVTIGVSVLAAIALGAMIYFQREKIDQGRAEADNLRQSIAQDRELIKKTPELVKTVIVQRETDNVIEEILASEKDIINLVRTLYTFAEESGVTITQLKEKRNARAAKGRKQDFEQVGYTLNFEGNGFHLLAFLEKVESHPRFMSVTAFKLTAATRNDYDNEEGPVHRVQVDLETYVYTPTGATKAVKIDHYERKRDLLISEISKRASELRIAPYDYRGPRGRRDPWIDPRVVVEEGTAPPMPIEQQLELVGDLVDRAHIAENLFRDVNEAPNVIAEMKARAKLEEVLAVLDEDVRRVQDENILTYILAEKRFQNQVVAVVERLSADSVNLDLGQGPSIAMLVQTAETMENHIRQQEYEMAIEVFDAFESRMKLAEGDEKLALVQSMHELKALAETVIEFERIAIDIDGIAIYEDRRPVALINGEPVTEGELVGQELIVRNITTEQIEFAFRGLVLARLVAPDSLTNPN